MDNNLKIKMYAFTMDCKDAVKLAEFYARLLEWTVVFHDEEYAVTAAPGAKMASYPSITFQQNPDFVPPVWPDKPQEQQQMAHLDFAVNDLKGAVEHAVVCGATVADEQFSEGWTVMLDPEGHPFCLCEMKKVFESPDFALL